MFTMKCSRGQVILVVFPDSNLRTGKFRPGLVVQADNLATGLPQTIVAMITTNLTLLAPAIQAGFRCPSVRLKASKRG